MITEQELIELGFVVCKQNANFMDLEADKFSISFCVTAYGNEQYFFIYTFMSGDREGAPYPVFGLDALKALIKSHEEYFK